MVTLSGRSSPRRVRPRHGLTGVHRGRHVAPTAVTVGDLWLGSSPVEDDLAAFTAADDVEGFFKFLGW